jgi:hypothetical protein
MYPWLLAIGVFIWVLIFGDGGCDHKCDKK